MPFTEQDKIKATMLYHLRRKRVIGNVHTPYDTLNRGFPSNLGKDADIAAKNLIKEGFILTKPISYGLQVSLNKERLKEIEEFILKVLGLDF
ncbi:hypothetical protein HYT54_02595 [Candidatus Woesearchaeota archaeon]|nr:hypothetical protein [Candidatus Woesearchaeota archaeon]